MAREIKFRAWYKDTKMMLDDVPVWKNMHYHISDESENLGGDFSECELMQYIGLGDIESNELYEGDIVEYINKRGEKQRRFIGFGNGSYRLKKSNRTKDTKDRIIFAKMIYRSKLTVIGNIHKDPELLNIPTQ